MSVLPARSSNPPLIRGPRYLSARLRFITEELGFESDQQSVDFLKDQSADGILQHRDDEFHIDCKAGRPLFAAAQRAALQKIDIRGQI